jgi:Mlc titration factor MtfA (ptsG expression regulator)
LQGSGPAARSAWDVGEAWNVPAPSSIHATQQLPVLAFSKNARREALRAKPPAEAWRAIVDKNVPYAAWLDAEDRRELWALVQIFLAEKRFEGCGGLSITEEMKVTIAAQACLLLLHRPNDVYPDLQTILVYPHSYKARDERRAGAVIVESDGARLGESWTRGVVVLAWDHVRAATHPATDGHNLVLHEFAHQLDAEGGAMNGAPAVRKPSRSLLLFTPGGARGDAAGWRSHVHTNPRSDGR